MTEFQTIIKMIQEAREKAFQSVNTELITLYWNVGEYVHQKVESEEWGSAVIDKLADYIKTNQPDIKGFSRAGIYRMKQFYNTYKGLPKLIKLAKQISWTNNLLIFGSSKSIEEKEFYLRLSISERYTKRELERQINSAYFERVMLSEKNVSPLVRQFKNNPNISHVFKDTYLFEFLDLPKNYSEKDLKKGLIANLRDFILELGKGFTFMGEEYRVQVGNSDFYIDLLFFHRELQCMVCFEVKLGAFHPKDLGQLNFYLEALDRDVKLAHENPSVGVILCSDKDNQVVEYALSRNLSPTLVSEYQTKLIDKAILQAKMEELFTLRKSNEEEE